MQTWKTARPCPFRYGIFSYLDISIIQTTLDPKLVWITDILLCIHTIKSTIICMKTLVATLMRNNRYIKSQCTELHAMLVYHVLLKLNSLLNNAGECHGDHGLHQLIIIIFSLSLHVLPCHLLALCSQGVLAMLKSFFKPIFFSKVKFRKLAQMLPAIYLVSPSVFWWPHIQLQLPKI